MNTDNKKSIIGDITPLPWRIVQHASNDNLQYIFGKNDWIIKEVEADLPQQKANAAYIVLACNLFPELLEALEEFVKAYNQDALIPLSPSWTKKMNEASLKAKELIQKAKQ